MSLKYAQKNYVLGEKRIEYGEMDIVNGVTSRTAFSPYSEIPSVVFWYNESIATVQELEYEEDYFYYMCLVQGSTILYLREGEEDPIFDDAIRDVKTYISQEDGNEDIFIVEYPAYVSSSHDLRVTRLDGWSTTILATYERENNVIDDIFFIPYGINKQCIITNTGEVYINDLFGSVLSDTLVGSFSLLGVITSATIDDGILYVIQYDTNSTQHKLMQFPNFPTDLDDSVTLVIDENDLGVGDNFGYMWLHPGSPEGESEPEGTTYNLSVSDIINIFEDASPVEAQEIQDPDFLMIGLWLNNAINPRTGLLDYTILDDMWFYRFVLSEAEISLGINKIKSITAIDKYNKVITGKIRNLRYTLDGILYSEDIGTSAQFNKKATINSSVISNTINRTFPYGITSTDFEYYKNGNILVRTSNNTLIKYASPFSSTVVETITVTTTNCPKQFVDLGNGNYATHDTSEYTRSIIQHPYLDAICIRPSLTSSSILSTISHFDLTNIVQEINSDLIQSGALKYINTNLQNIIAMDYEPKRNELIICILIEMNYVESGIFKSRIISYVLGLKLNANKTAFIKDGPLPRFTYYSIGQERFSTFSGKEETNNFLPVAFATTSKIPITTYYYTLRENIVFNDYEAVAFHKTGDGDFTYTGKVVEHIRLTPSVREQKTWNQSVFDTLYFNTLAGQRNSFKQFANDTITFTYEIENYRRTGSDQINLTESVKVSNLGQRIKDTFSFTENAKVQSPLNITASDIITFVEKVNGIYTIELTETIIFEENISGQTHNIELSETIELIEQARHNIIFANVFDSFTLTDKIKTNIYIIPITETISITDTSRVTNNHIRITETISINSLPTARNSIREQLEEEISISTDVRNHVMYLNTSEDVVFSEFARPNIILKRMKTTIILDYRLRYPITKNFDLDEEITFTENAEEYSYPVSTDIELTQTLLPVHSKKVTGEITLTMVVDVNKLLNIELEEEIALSSSGLGYIKPTNLHIRST